MKVESKCITVTRAVVGTSTQVHFAYSRKRCGLSLQMLFVVGYKLVQVDTSKSCVNIDIFAQPFCGKVVNNFFTLLKSCYNSFNQPANFGIVRDIFLLALYPIVPTYRPSGAVLFRVDCEPSPPNPYYHRLFFFEPLLQFFIRFFCFFFHAGLDNVGTTMFIFFSHGCITMHNPIVFDNHRLVQLSHLG